MTRHYAKTGKVSGKSRGTRSRNWPRAGSDQPLKPVTFTWRFWTVLLTSGILLTFVSLRNMDTISWHLNRPIHTLQVDSALQHVTESEVKTLLAVYMGEGFFEIDVSSVRERLETHPWIARAEVKRIWPDNLALSITEEVAIARWGQTRLLNQYADVFAPAQIGTMASLPLLSGPQGSQTKMMEQYQILNQLLFPAGLRLEQLNLSERMSWELVIEGGLKIVVGKVDVREKIKRLIDIYDTQIRNDIAVIETIDLRYSNGFSVKKKQQDITGVATR
ncbi:MAG: cell division protein FtsQ/DivIB [Gammaproteobacteria bacterium]|nr:cell division protein FtsQ/DivIB [Gammaproteobacteria bacterium]